MANPSNDGSVETDKKNGHTRSWVGPRTVMVHRTRAGFGFTLRHFIVYPPESAAQKLQDEESNCDMLDGSCRKRSKLSGLDPMDTIFVKHVKDDGPAQHAGLEKGDRIVSVNGQSVTGMSYSQVIALIQASDTSLKLLVVPKDEDILQMAYESSAYKQGKDPYQGSATEIPHPPQIHPRGQDTNMPPPPTTIYHPTRYKSEIHITTGETSQPHKLSGFDPRIPRQRLSTSSMGSVSSGSSYSTSKDVGTMHAHHGEVSMDTDSPEDVTMATIGPSGEAAAGAVPYAQSSAQKSYSSRSPPGVSFTVESGASEASSHNSPPLVSSSYPSIPPVAPSRSSSRNITLINFQPSSSSHQESTSFVHSSPQVAAAGGDRRLLHRVASVESLERSSDSSSSRNSDTVQSYSSQTAPPPLEKLLRTSHETGVRRTSRDSLRHASDGLLPGSNGTPEKQSAGRVSTTHLPPGTSTTITLSPQTHAATSPSLPPSGNQSRSQWMSESHVYKMDSPIGIQQRNPSSSAKDITASPRLQCHNGRVVPDRTDSYGLTVSLHRDTHKPNYADKDYKVPNLSRRGERNSVPDRTVINMVSERLRKFESADSVDTTAPVWRQRIERSHHGYDGIHVLSRAAEFESKYDDDDRSRRKRTSLNSPFSTPTGSTTSLPQALPPPEIHKVPPTPPATINFYFRESSHGGSVNLEPSPECMLIEPNPDGFRMRVSSEPPDVSTQRIRRREPSPGSSISISYGDQMTSPVAMRRPATRQRSYLTAVSSGKDDPQLQYLYPEFKAATLPLRIQDLGQGHSPSHSRSSGYKRHSLMSEFYLAPDGRMPPNSSDTMTTPTTSMATSTVTLRERSRSEDREARLVRRTSYLLATGRQNTGAHHDPKRVDISQLIVPSPPATSTTGELPKPVWSKLDHPVPLSPCTELPEPVSPGIRSEPVILGHQSEPVSPGIWSEPVILGNQSEPVSPGNQSAPVSPGNQSPSAMTAHRSPGLDTVVTPTKTSNIKKLKNLFGERTPRILEAITDKKTLFDMPSPVGGISLEGTLLCKIAVTDGKRASDRSWKPCFAQLRGPALYLYKDKNSVNPTPFEDQPISIKSSIVDIAYDYTKKKNVFRLTTYNGSEYLFQADDHDVMLQWIRVIHEHNNPDEDKEGAGNTAHTDLITRKQTQQEAVPTNRSSPQVAPKSKKTSTRSLRSKSPSSHSPGPKPKKQLSEKDLMDPTGPKSKDCKTWKGRMAKKFKRYGSSSSTSADIPETSDTPEYTGTFGVPLELCPCSTFSEFVPLVVEVCTRIVEERGLENQGIYRVPGNTGAVNFLQEEFNKAVVCNFLQEEFNKTVDYDNLDMESEKWLDVNVVSSLLKSFFRKLPDPLVTEELYQAVINANRTSHQTKRMLKIKKLLHDLPEHNFETFRYIAEHLNHVSEKGDLNKMDGRNLAIVFGPTLIRTSDDNMVTMVTDMSDQCRIVESIIANYKWFFSSWFEDVNVPVEEQTDTVPVSGMNQELLVKAENLGERGRDVSVKDLMSSVIQAANRKIRKRPDKPKTSDSVDIDFESEPNSYNERNIDREIELRKGKELSQNCLTKESSCISLEQASSSTAATLTCSMSVQESKSSLSLDQGAAKEMAMSNIDLKTSMSSLGAMSLARSGTSLNQPVEKGQWSPPCEHSKRRDKRDDLPIKRYPAYPRVDIGSSPQIDNTKPTLLKKYSSEELHRGEWTLEPAEVPRGEWRRENDEVKKTYGLTPQTRQQLRRIEQETEALRQREQEQKKDQERTALAKQRVEMELQKTKRELEDDHSIDDLLMPGEDITGKITDYKQKYSDYINNTMDSRSATSDYSTMSSMNAPYVSSSQSKPSVNRHHMDYSPVRSSSSVPRELYFSSTHDKPAGDRRRSPPRNRLDSSHVSSTSSLPSGPDRGQKEDSRLKKSHRVAHGRPVDKTTERLSGDDGHRLRKGSLDSLLDIGHHDMSHIDSDEEDKSKKEEGLLESIASADPQFKTLLSTGANRKAVLASSKHRAKPSAKDTDSRSKLKSERTLPFRDPTLHKGSGDPKVIGIASRFERKKSDDSKSPDKAVPCYKSDSRPVGTASASSNSVKLSSASRHSKENQPPRPVGGASSKSRSDQRLLTSQKSASNPPNRIHRQDSGSQSLEQYASSLRKSTEKLFGSSDNLIDLRSPEEEVQPPSITGAEKSKPLLPQVALKATDHKFKRRRHTVGGTDDLEHMKALVTATHQYLNRGEDARRSAWDRLQPKSPVTDDIRDIKSWCMQQRLRHVGSSPALNDPQFVAVSFDEPPMKRMGSVKSGDGKQPSRSGSSHSQKSSSHSSSASPSSPAPRGGPNSFNFVHPI